MHRNQPREVKKKEETEKFVPQKGTRENSKKKKNLNEIEISDLPDKEFKAMVIKMLSEIRGAIHEQTENFNKEVENIIKYKTKIIEMNNIITELKKFSRGVQH